MTIAVSTGQVLGVIQDAFATGARFESVRVRLFKNNFTPSPSSVFADFTEADFPGYGVQTVNAWTSAYPSGSGKATVDATELANYNASGDSDNIVYGYYVCSPTSDAVFWAERFPAGVPMTAALDHIGVLLRLDIVQMNGAALVAS